jgi:hypothetical protein
MAEMTWSGTWPDRVAVTDRKVDNPTLRVVFVAAAAASSWFVLANATGALRQFGGHVQFLGRALSFAASAPSLVAWSLVLTAALVVLPYGKAPNAPPALRFGLTALVTGAVLEVLAAVCSLWVSELSSQFGGVTLHIAQIEDLLRTSDTLTCVALLAFAAAAWCGRTSTWHRSALDGEPARNAPSVRWRVAMWGIAVALCVGAIGQAYEVVGSMLSVAPPFQLTIVMVDALTAVLWIGVTGSLLVVARVLRADARHRPMAQASSVGALGASLLGLAAISQFAYFEIAYVSPTNPGLLDLSRLSTASECVAWLVLTIAFGLAAVSMHVRSSVRALELPTN